MPQLPSEVAKSLNYLRKRYKVSERDLVNLAKKLSKKEEPEESWEEITQRYLRSRKTGRFIPQRGKFRNASY